MRILYQASTVILAGLILAQFLPWWSIALSGFGAGFQWSGSRFRSFLGGFLGALLLWTVTAMLIAQWTGSDLGDKFAMLVGLPGDARLLALVAGGIGGFVAGIAAVAGDGFRQAFFPAKKRN
ncbi:MAG: hypothetical protein RLZZ165_1448 [Bacteroidota bacterium]